MPYKDKEKKRECKNRSYQKNKEKIKERLAIDYKKNPEKYKKRIKKWMENSPEKYKKSLENSERVKNPEKYKEYMKNWYKGNIKKAKKEQKKWRNNNPEKYKENNRRLVLKKYSLTIEDFEKMVKNQNNTCLICSQKIKKLCVDHDHRTGRVRGLLCRVCNLLLGAAQDNIEILEKAIKYLESYKN